MSTWVTLTYTCHFKQAPQRGLGDLKSTLKSTLWPQSRLEVTKVKIIEVYGLWKCDQKSSLSGVFLIIKIIIIKTPRLSYLVNSKSRRQTLPRRKNETPTPRATILVKLMTLGVGFDDFDATLRAWTGNPLTICKGRLGERGQIWETLSPKRPLQNSDSDDQIWVNSKCVHTLLISHKHVLCFS